MIFTIMGHKPTTDGTKYLNTLREDTNPSCHYTIGDDGLIRLIDFASVKFRRCTCFDLLIIKSQDDVRPIRSFSECLKVVNEMYGLGLGSSQETAIVHKKQSYSVAKQMQSTLDIRINALDGFSQKAMDYWTKYAINPALFNAETENEKIYEVTKYYYTDKSNSWIEATPAGLCFAYYFENTGHFKIYNPYPGEKEIKWFSNCSADDIYGEHDYDSLSRLVVTKSWKDRVALKQMGFNVVAFQNEGCKPDFKDGDVLLFDNDAPGIEAAAELAKHYECESCIIDPKFGCTDVGEFIEKYGQEKAKPYFTKIIK